MKKLLVIQEHKADRAGLHWDLRMEKDDGFIYNYLRKRPMFTNEPRTYSDKVLMSWVIKKCRLPEVGERLLCIQTEDHPWDYRNFEGVISEGYGKGKVKLVFSNEVEVLEYKGNKIVFIYENKKYILFKVDFGWLIIQKE